MYHNLIKLGTRSTSQSGTRKWASRLRNMHTWQSQTRECPSYPHSQFVHPKSDQPNHRSGRCYFEIQQVCSLFIVRKISLNTVQLSLSLHQNFKNTNLWTHQMRPFFTDVDINSFVHFEELKSRNMNIDYIASSLVYCNRFL